MPQLDLWKAVGLFGGLTDEQLQRLVDISREEHFRDEDVIVEQGTEGEKMYLICEGQVEILIRRTPRETARSEVYLGRGQVFGEMALLDLGKRSATVRCCQDGTILYSVSREDFNQLCSNDTAIGYVVIRNLATDLSFKLRHRNLDLGSGDV
ncbi:MAG TPA: cyclic nucleotide-binding domain-containing protein [Aggregatilineaceae bacterium]|nr:cyclic nucleotide-binding domain-containing protein [Aggregatilineaceae bacterium]